MIFPLEILDIIEDMIDYALDNEPFGD